MNSPLCPMCGETLHKPGRIAQGEDETGLHFVYVVCHGCTASLMRQPIWKQRKRHNEAAFRLAEDTSSYAVRTFPRSEDAALFRVLAAETDSDELIALFD